MGASIGYGFRGGGDHKIIVMDGRTIAESNPVLLRLKVYDVTYQQVDTTIQNASQRPANCPCTLLLERNIQPSRLKEVTIAGANHHHLGFAQPQPFAKSIGQDRSPSSSPKNQDPLHKDFSFCRGFAPIAMQRQNRNVLTFGGKFPIRKVAPFTRTRSGLFNSW